MIYTQFNAKIQTLRSNNGKEYFNQTFHLIFGKRFSFINFFVPKHHNNLKLILACHLHNKSLPPNQHIHLELEIEPEIEPKIEPLPNRIQEKEGEDHTFSLKVYSKWNLLVQEALHDQAEFFIR